MAELIAGHMPHPIHYDNVPSVTYCHPEVASIGLTEEQCKEKKLDYQVGRFPFSANGRARASNETEGFVKIIRDKKYGEILGAHIVGEPRLRDDPRAGGGAGERVHRRGGRSRDPRASDAVRGDRRGGARLDGPGPPHLNRVRVATSGVAAAALFGRRWSTLGGIWAWHGPGGPASWLGAPVGRPPRRSSTPARPRPTAPARREHLGTVRWSAGATGAGGCLAPIGSLYRRAVLAMVSAFATVRARARGHAGPPAWRASPACGPGRAAPGGRRPPAPCAPGAPRRCMTRPHRGPRPRPAAVRRSARAAARGSAGASRRGSIARRPAAAGRARAGRHPRPGHPRRRACRFRRRS